MVRAYARQLYLSAYVGRAYLEVKGRPPYLVMEVIKRRKPSAAATDLRETVSIGM